jgi:putative transposase
MVRDRLDVSERWACRVVGQHRSSERYQPTRAGDDAAFRAELGRISTERPRWGYRRAHALLGEEGWEVNRNRCSACGAKKGHSECRSARARPAAG